MVPWRKPIDERWPSPIPRTWPWSPGHSGQTSGVLECGDQRERRLGALVEIGSTLVESVEASAGRGVEHRAVRVVVAEEPGDHALQVFDPDGRAGDVGG